MVLGDKTLEYTNDTIDEYGNIHGEDDKFKGHINVDIKTLEVIEFSKEDIEKYNPKGSVKKHYFDHIRNSIVTHPELGNILFLNVGAEEIYSTNRPKDYYLLTKMPDIVLKSKYAYTEDLKHDRSDKILKYHILYGKIKKPYKTQIIMSKIAEDVYGNKFYMYKPVLTEKDEKSNSLYLPTNAKDSLTANSSPGGSRVTSKYIIIDSLINFNPIVAEYNEENKMEELQNAKDWAKTYKGHSVMYEGIATYKDEAVYLSQDTLKKCMPELKGRPVIIEHKLGINPSNMEDNAVGYVTNCEYNNETGDFDCDFVIFDDEAKKLLKNGYTLSTSYIAKSFDNGGTYINTPYDREITGMDFTHLAIVKNPRYEKVKVYQNSIDEIPEDIQEKILEKQNNSTESGELQNDIIEEKEICMDKIEVDQNIFNSLLEMVTRPFNNSKKEDDTFEYEGAKYSKQELVNCWKKNAKCNEEDAETEDVKDVVEEKEEKPAKKANEVETEEVVVEEAPTEETKPEEEKENSVEEVDWFEKMQELMNSNHDEDDKIPPAITVESSIEKGKKIYG